jgi:hypothetical protein
MEAEIMKRSVAGLVKPVYRIFKAETAGDFSLQWQNCLDSFQCYLSEHHQYKPFIIRVFISADNEQEFKQYSEEIRTSFSSDDLPISIISERPEKPALVCIEAGFTDPSIHVEYGNTGRVKYCRLTKQNYSEIWIAGSGGSSYSGIYQSAMYSFSQLLNTFEKLGTGFNHIVRQWNYVEKIFTIGEAGEKTTQHYQQFNEARADYYSRYRTVPDYPAATGIGAAFGGVTIECCLIAGTKDLRIIPISNPRQINSYQYGQSVLKGMPVNKGQKHRTPQFERALLLTNSRYSRLFISGTAAIIGQNTAAPGDVRKQTLITLANMEALADKKNLLAHCPGLTVFPDQYAYVRVYVKNEEDLPDVRDICMDYLGDVPINFLTADICRSDLLVEIEAEKIS